MLLTLGLLVKEIDMSNFEIEKLEKNAVRVTIKVEAGEAEKEYAKACSKLAQRVNIPGFRKGKAPRRILEKALGVDAIKQEALQEIFSKELSKVIYENNFNMVSEPKLESFDYEIGKEVVLVINLDLCPEIEIDEYKGLEIEVEGFVHSEDAIEKELERIANHFSEIKTVEEVRPTVDTDLVDIDFDGTCNSEKIKGGEGQGYLLDLAHSNFIPGFAEQLVGKNVGEEFEIEVTFPTDYHDEKLKGQNAQFKIKINAIKTRELHEINDELAKKAGNYENVEALKDALKANLENYKNKENTVRATEAIFDKLLKDIEVEIQDSMISNETQNLLQEFKTNTELQGAGSFNQAIESIGRENLWNELKSQAEKRIKRNLAVANIAKKEGITFSNEDLQAHLINLAAATGMGIEDIVKELNTSRKLLNNITNQIVFSKVIEFLRANNEIKFVETQKQEEVLEQV